MSGVRPLIELAIEPKSQSDQDKLCLALAKLADDDSTFWATTDRESGQTIIGGVDERQLALKVDALRDIFGIAFESGAPQVAYLETITETGTIDYTHKKRNVDSGQFARVKIEAAPLPPGSGFGFENKVAPGSIPKECMAGVEKGLESVVVAGALAGFPVVDLKVSLIEGASHDADSLAFEMAARGALREALKICGAVLLEPIMKVAVVTPEDHASAVIGDLTLRRGQIQDQIQDVGGSATTVEAMVPLAEMLGYAGALHALSGGKATFKMRCHHYAPVAISRGTDPFPPGTAMAMSA